MNGCFFEKEDVAVPKKKQKPQETPQAEINENQVAPTAEAQAPAALSPAPSNLPAPSDNTRAVDKSVPPIQMPDLGNERRNFWGRVLLLLVLAAVLAGALLIFLYRPGAYSERVNSVKFLYNEESDETEIAVNGTLLEERVDGSCTTYAYDSDGSICAALIGDELYLIDGRELSSLCEDVADFYLAQNGKAIAYRTVENVLYYAVLGREVETSVISKDTTDPHYCLSPDGKELFYTYVYEESTRIDMYSRTNSKPNFAKTTSFVPIAVGDRCKYIYYKDSEGTLFYATAKDPTPVKCFASEQPYTLTFNRDFSEVLIDGELGTQLWKKGKMQVISALKSGEQLVLQPNQRAAARELPEGGQYLIKSFGKNYYLRKGHEDDGVMLVYLDRKGKLQDVSFVSETESRITVTDKGVYYLEIVEQTEETQRHLFRCKSGETEPERLSWENITEFCVNSDGTCLFYTDHHGALYAMRVGSVPERLADTIVQGSLYATADDVFYYNVDDELYASENGGKPRTVRETPSFVLVDGYTAYFLELDEEDGTVTVSANHRNRRRDTKLAEGVTQIK